MPDIGIAAWDIGSIERLTSVFSTAPAMPCNSSETSRERFALLSGIMRTLAFCICENRRGSATAQLFSAIVFATQMVQFSYEIQNFKPLAIFCGRTARFVSDLVGNPEDEFSLDAAHLFAFTRALQRSLRKNNCDI